MFSFGQNWLNFLKKADNKSFNEAKYSIENIIDHIGIKDGNFLDVGCGSGLFSLAARQIDFNVTSFDYDKKSVLATESLKNKYFSNDKKWKILNGSILDKLFLKSFNSEFDVVYSWGVLHHTGNMNLAFVNIADLVKIKGHLIISIYNDQGILSDYWKIIKKLYNINIFLRFFIILFHFPFFMILRPIKKLIIDKKIIDNRGMKFWYDYIDWLGGYPFEVAKPKDVISFFKKKGYILKKVTYTYGRLGCNEFIFQRKSV